ncbi:glycoside hydrolase family 9 protein [Chitinophaga sp. GCM10012297]|uniref:Endoglucanase n=1 Tax=Chitinophaga chungangae TaxID=2821488 RepID=A0ABS3YKI8_9BACT|nr:glycoside hydrolase family 9 protein [Chitinophaga chungangae]MBO9155203.1 glycoside hydrolase family 9 protein [Chitinophaga chungangae]
MKGTIVCMLLALPAMAQQRIQLNQAGFYPYAPKIAVVTGSNSGENFYVVAGNGKDTLFSGRLGTEQRSANSSTLTRIADFSVVTKEGQYVLVVPGVGASYSFAVSKDALKKPAAASLKGFYFQRSNITLEEKYAGKWHRSAGHPDDTVYVHASAAGPGRPAGTVIASPGGWYDAGDYNKYIVNSGISMSSLLSAYEDFPAYYASLRTAIPESGNALPDILDEAVYNLRWMLTMQDPADGGVYHKCTNASFDGMVMPGVTKLPRYVVQKSTAAALDFAAVTAQAARVLKTFSPRLSDSCLKAAAAAWQWAEKNPAAMYDQNAMNKQFQPAVTTGAYGDNDLKDEWSWAAAEMYITTKNERYYGIFKEHLKDNVSLPTWRNVAMQGYYTLLRASGDLPAVREDLPLIKERVLHLADGYVSKQPGNAFRTVMGQSRRDFSWGGSSVAANQGILLLYAWRLTNKQHYLDAALSNMDYLLGRNATGYSFLTGSGSKPVMHPHHRPSIADGIEDPVPGLLSGGPNPGRQDSCYYQFTEPETAFSDTACSYASNEIAINWNAPLVYLANALEALKKKARYVK